MSSAELGPVLVGWDGSEGSEQALAWAAEEACRTGAALVAVYVRPGSAPGPAAADDVVVRESINRSFEASLAGLGLPGGPVELALRSGDPTAALAREAADRAASILVVGSRGRGGLSSLLLGSVSDNLAQSPHQPLVVTRPAPSPSRSLGRIVVGVDGSAPAKVALAWAAAVASRRRCHLEVVLAWGLPEASPGMTEADSEISRQLLDDRASELLGEHLATLNPGPGPSPRGVLRHGRAAEVLLQQAEGADLVVVGTRGLSGFSRGHLGSVSRAVLHRSQTPVAIIPAITDVADVEVEAEV